MKDLVFIRRGGAVAPRQKLAIGLAFFALCLIPWVASVVAAGPYTLRDLGLDPEHEMQRDTRALQDVKFTVTVNNFCDNFEHNVQMGWMMIPVTSNLENALLSMNREIHNATIFAFLQAMYSTYMHGMRTGTFDAIPKDVAFKSYNITGSIDAGAPNVVFALYVLPSRQQFNTSDGRIIIRRVRQHASGISPWIGLVDPLKQKSGWLVRNFWALKSISVDFADYDAQHPIPIDIFITPMKQTATPLYPTFGWRACDSGRPNSFTPQVDVFHGGLTKKFYDSVPMTALVTHVLGGTRDDARAVQQAILEANQGDIPSLTPFRLRSTHKPQFHTAFTASYDLLGPISYDVVNTNTRISALNIPLTLYYAESALAVCIMDFRRVLTPMATTMPEVLDNSNSLARYNVFADRTRPEIGRNLIKYISEREKTSKCHNIPRTVTVTGRMVIGVGAAANAAIWAVMAGQASTAIAIDPLADRTHCTSIGCDSPVGEQFYTPMSTQDLVDFEFYRQCTEDSPLNVCCPFSAVDWQLMCRNMNMSAFEMEPRNIVIVRSWRGLPALDTRIQAITTACAATGRPNIVTFFDANTISVGAYHVAATRAIKHLFASGARI